MLVSLHTENARSTSMQALQQDQVPQDRQE